MKRKINFRVLADYILILVSMVFAITSWIIMHQQNIVWQWQHYVGAIFLLINIFVLVSNHQAGVLLTGLMLILGVTGIASFDAGLVSFKMGPVKMGNPLLFVLLAFHIIISMRFYDGILTKKYWDAFFGKNKM